MKRVDLSLPDEFVFETDLSVRVSDLNYGGHLGNDAVLSLVHEGRIRFLEELGYAEDDVGGPGLIMADTAIRFRSEADRESEIRMQVTPSEVGKVGFDLYYLLSDIREEEVVAEVKTGMVCYDYDAGSVCPLPGEFRERLEEC